MLKISGYTGEQQFFTFFSSFEMETYYVKAVGRGVP